MNRIQIFSRFPTTLFAMAFSEREKKLKHRNFAKTGNKAEKWTKMHSNIMKCDQKKIPIKEKKMGEDPWGVKNCSTCQMNC